MFLQIDLNPLNDFRVVSNEPELRLRVRLPTGIVRQDDRADHELDGVRHELLFARVDFS